MKKILIIVFLLISSLSYSQINKLKIGKSNLTDSSGFLKIKSDSIIEMLSYLKFDKKILGDVDITGQYLINGIPLPTGGGDMFISSRNHPTELNIFDSLSVVKIVSNLPFYKGSTVNFGTADNFGINFITNNFDRGRLDSAGNVYWYGSQSVSGDLSVGGTSIALNGGFLGDGSQITNINASNISIGTLNQSFLPSNVAFTDISNIFSAQRNTFKSINLVSGADDTIGTGDNFALYFKVNNSPKIKIASNGILNLYSNTLNFTSGSDIVTGTTDDYSYQIKTSDTNRVAISNRGVFSINSKNLVLGGNFTTSGSSALTFTTSGTTSLTLPTSGTLMTGSNLVTGSTDNAILRADGTGGVTTQSSGITIDDNNNIVLPTTVIGNTTGIIYKGSTRFMHNYADTSTIGGNLFVGLNSGNFTLTYNTFNYTASSNIGLGDNTLNALTYGYNNTAIGNGSLALVTTGVENLGLGTSAMSKVVSGTNNVGVGSKAGQFTTGSYNMVLGSSSGLGVNGSSTYSASVGVGYFSLNVLTTGDYNIAIGYRAGDILTTGANNIIIGKDVDPSGATVSNELNIGNVIYGTGMYGTGKIGIMTATPNSTFSINGSFAPAYVAKTATYTATATDYLIDCTANTFTVTLPTAVGCTGRIYIIKNSGSGTITIATTSSQTIDGASTKSLASQYDKITVQSNNANWIVLSY